MGTNKNLGSLTLNMSGAATLGLATPITVTSSVYLVQGILDNATNAVTLANNATIYRTSGVFSAAPTFTTGVNVQYLNNANIATGNEIPLSPTVLKTLTVNCGSYKVRLSTDITVNTNLTLTSGFIDAITNNRTLIMVDNATVSPGAPGIGSPTSFVIGYMRKIGNDQFTFPLGIVNDTATIWAPLGISAPALVTDAFDVKYVFNSIFDDIGIAPWNTSLNMGPGLHHVSYKEYWMVNRTVGTSTPTVTLHWKDNVYHLINDLADLTVAHWNASALPNPRWEKMSNNSANTNGTLSTGTIVTDVAFPHFSPVTFGSEAGTNPLPVELVDVKALLLDTRVNISWTTKTETNNDYFDVERSSDGINFIRISSVKGFGTTSLVNYYTTFDNAPLYGLSYYRLKQVDFNGEYTYSNIVSVHYAQPDFSNRLIRLFPSVSRSLAEVYLTCDHVLPNEQFMLSVFDITGVLVARYEIQADKNGTLNCKPFKNGDFSHGVYTIQISGTNTSESKRLILE
jgi:hypothetical protein